ncbi:MAG: MFS transporter, partial [Trueperaceae bacterium]
RAVLLGSTLALCALGLVLMPMGPSVAVFALASVVLGIGSGVSQPMTMVVLSDHVDPSRRGAALGARLSVNFLALGLATMTLGAVVPIIGYPIAFIAGALLPVSAAAMVGSAGSRLEPPREAGPPRATF